MSITPRTPTRRDVANAAAWSVPVVAAALAAPLAAASDAPSVGDYRLTGSCGVQGVQGPGFVLTADPSLPMPVGTTVLIVGSGVANIGVFSATPSGTTSQARLSATSTQFTLTSELSAGSAIAFRTTLSTSVRWTLRAVATPPEGFVAGGDSKSEAEVTSALTGCSAG